MDATRELTPRSSERFHYRSWVSFSVTIAFLALAVSGAVLYVAPRGRDANWSGWTCLTLWREDWVGMHIAIGTAFLMFGVLHLVLNWRPLWGYLHSRTRRGIRHWRELLLATVLLAALSVAAVRGWPPAHQLVGGSDWLKDYWSQTLPRAPLPHAELLTVDELAQRTDVPGEDLAQVLRDHGLGVDSPGQTLFQIAQANQSTPSYVFDILRQKVPEVENLPGGRRGGGGGKGLGRGQGRGGWRQK